jgi:acyl-CoA synthetase (AMP-forming)/AMP-acid ligase II
MRTEFSFELASFVDVLRSRAACEPDGLAYSFLNSRLQEETVVTYGELNFRVRALAAFLQELGASGERVLVLSPPGLQFVTAFFGCLYSGAVAVPAYPPQAFQINQTLPRLRGIIRDAEPLIGLVTPDILGLLERLFPACEELRKVRWLNLPNLTGDAAAKWKPIDIQRDSLALLQYTSGSTAEPKGVMVSHGNLLSNSEQIRRCFKLRPETRAVAWLPPYHDMGLMGGLLQPVYTGFRAYLMTPLSFLQRPVRWLQAISKFRADISGGPNFAYGLCVRRIGAEERNDLDLSCWKVAFNGAEPVHQQTLEQFAAAFSPYGFDPDGFSPCYGLAEATLLVSGQYRTPHSVSLAGTAVTACGQVDEHVAIVSPDSLNRCAAGSTGEIWVSGPHAGRGYWNRPDETERTFKAYIADTREGPFLRTGDLGFVTGGQLFVTGRLKDLIIIAGRNHYPQDIERTVEASHPALRPSACAAFTFSADGEEHLVIAAELERRPYSQAGDTEEYATAVSRAVRRAVAEGHDVQVHNVLPLKAGSIPKTSSGKIQRHACRDAFLAGGLELLESGK